MPKTSKTKTKTKTSKTKTKTSKTKTKTKTSKTKSKVPFKPKIKIENVVASAAVDAEMDLDKIAATLDNAEYEPEQFPGLVLRLKKDVPKGIPKAAILVFSSGKMVCTGSKEIRLVKVALTETLKQIRKCGIKVKGEATIKIQNIVASSDLKSELNLDKIAFTLENTEFEPEQFPGLVFRVAKPKVVFLLFRSGKIVCTGAKKVIDVRRGVEVLVKELKKAKVL